MKHIFKNLLIISLSISIFSCSKKVTTFNFGKAYHDQNLSQAKEEVILEENEEIVTSSNAETPVLIENKKEIVPATATPVIKTPVEQVKTEKPSFKERVVTKMLKKKIEKLEKKQAVSNNMKLGIIIAAVSLVVLIVVAAGLLGGLSSLFWILGGLGLLTGLIIILLAALDVI